MRLILIRHGAPAPEAKGKCYGRLDIELSDIGRTQIQTKLISLKNLDADALYTSPLKRALESATVLAVGLGIQPVIAPDLQEIDLGSFEGLSYSEIENSYPREYKLWMEHPTAITCPHGESFAEMKSRVLKFKQSLFDKHCRQTVMLVAHGGTNRIILADALGIADEMIFRIDQAYAAVNIIDFFDRYPVVRVING